MSIGSVRATAKAISTDTTTGSEIRTAEGSDLSQVFFLLICFSFVNCASINRKEWETTRNRLFVAERRVDAIYVVKFVIDQPHRSSLLAR